MSAASDEAAPGTGRRETGTNHWGAVWQPTAAPPQGSTTNSPQVDQSTQSSLLFQSPRRVTTVANGMNVTSSLVFAGYPGRVMPRSGSRARGLSMPDQRPPTLPTGELPSDASVPKVVVSRLSLYLRELQRLEAAGQQTISSEPARHAARLQRCPGPQRPRLLRTVRLPRASATAATN
jgi:hypothetical protein